MSKRQNTGQGYLLGDEPDGVDLTEVETEIDSIKAGFDLLNAQYQATASKYTQNGIIFPDNTQQTTAAGTPVPHSQNSSKNSIFIGHEANKDSNSGNYNCAVGYRAHGFVMSGGGQWNTNVGALAGLYYMGQMNVFIGYSSGGGGSSSSGGQKVGNNNVMIGEQCGQSSGGHRNLFIGSLVGKNAGSGNDRFKMGYDSHLLLDGKIPTSSTGRELRINAGLLEIDKDNVPTTYNSTYPDRIWRDDGVLRVGPSKSMFISVSGKSTGTNANTTVFSNSFTTYVFPVVESDTSSRYETSNGHVELNDAGLYLIQATAHIADASTAGLQFGVSVGTTTEWEGDPFFLWHAVQDTNNSFDRTSYPYTRVARFSANDELRMRVFVNDTTGAMMHTMEMKIWRLSD